MKKSELRHIYKEKRQQLSSPQREKMNDCILIQFQRLPIVIPDLLMTFAPIAKFNEFDPYVLTEYCYFKNAARQLVYPVMDKTGEGDPALQPVLVNEDTFFETNKNGIDEPVDGIVIDPLTIGLVIVPMLCFDTGGYRVGYGKGYYDRFLQQCNKNCIKIMASYFEPVDTIDDINEYDVKMDYCITPETIYQFH